MGYSDMEFRGRRFDAHDVHLAVWMQYVVAAMDALPDRAAWLETLREDWSQQATQGFGFGIVPALDRHVTDDERKAILRPLFRAALEAMDRHTDTMTAGELNARQASGPDAVFTADLPMESFRRVARLALELFEDDRPVP